MAFEDGPAFTGKGGAQPIVLPAERPLSTLAGRRNAWALEGAELQSAVRPDVSEAGSFSGQEPVVEFRVLLALLNAPLIPVARTVIPAVIARAIRTTRSTYSVAS